MPAAPFTDPQLALLRAVIDRIVPPDEDPGGTGLGADRYVLGQLSGARAFEAGMIGEGLDALERAARAEGGAFASLPAATQDALLARGEAEPWFVRLVALVQEGVYANPANGGNAGAAGWRMIGYEHRMPEGPDGPPRRPPQPPRALGASDMADYDVIVVGAGAGGGVMACRLAEAGRTVLLLERGREVGYAHDGHRDHLRNHRLSVYGHNTGPGLADNPRVYVDAEGVEHIVPPHHPWYHNNAAAVGSATVLYGAQAWRFHPNDFRMASRYGVPEGSSLVDWPIGYDDLAPWYDWVEWNLGVAGDGADTGGARGRGHPMPPAPRYERQALLQRGAEALGLRTLAVPLLLNTVPYNGRGACIQCGSCVGFPCPSDAKTGTHNTMIPRALATGRTRLVTGAMVERIDHDAAGRVTGVTYAAETAEGGRTRHTARAKAVVVAAGAIETARLMLLSASSRYPEGLGNAHDQVGRHLQGHTYPIVYGRFDTAVHDSRGPGASIATTSYLHGNPGVVGGAMLADDFVMVPAIFFKQALPPELRRWGHEAKDFMRRHYRQVARVTGPVHEVPDPNSRVTLAEVTDGNGLRVARLSGLTHPETIRTARFIEERAAEWLRASGARESWGVKPVRRLSAGQHQAGTCRMGTDPARSVTDAFGRVWGHENLFVADASLHPTNGSFNPVLTIMALTARNAEHVLAVV